MSKDKNKNPAKAVKEWEDLAATEIKAKDTKQIEWLTPEGILVKPVYSAEDLEQIDHLHSMP